MRSINEKFIYDLSKGKLSYFLCEVKNNKTLSLEIRGGYINIYYRGGNLLRITQKQVGYEFFFDVKYCTQENDKSLIESLSKRDSLSYVKNFNRLIDIMDQWFETHPKLEREHQHSLLIHNPKIVDVEYQVKNISRLDMLMVDGNTLYIVENKYGLGAVSGKAGLAKHYQDISKIIEDIETRNQLLKSIEHITHIKHALGLRDYLVKVEDIHNIEILFVLVNYNQKSQSLQNELNQIHGKIESKILYLNSDEIKIDLSKAQELI
jgi:hypothetical protein